jgi:hypothetical protein
LIHIRMLDSGHLPHQTNCYANGISPATTEESCLFQYFLLE